MKKSLLFLLAALCSCTFTIPSDESGLEKPAVDWDDIILNHNGYVTSYNSDACIPEWVAYELTDEESRGTEQRNDRIFKMDPDYRGRQAKREDYSNSGWTKGHMAPARDFAWSSDAMDQTFYLTNICPQSEELNANDWNYLERRVRSWAREFGKVWVVTGPVIGKNKYGTIGERNVVVPDAFFKAVLAPVGTGYSAIGFVMGNDSRRYYLRDCSLSIDRLEDLTGIDFFPQLEDTVEEEVESRYRLSDWGIK